MSYGLANGGWVAFFEAVITAFHLARRNTPPKKSNIEVIHEKIQAK